MMPPPRGALLRLSLLTVLAMPAVQAAQAQTPTVADVMPRLTVNGSGEATAPAARATLSIGIETQGATAAEAGAEGARLADAVTAALRRAGLPAADLKSTHVVINPQWTFDDKTRQRRRTGFLANTTLMLDTGTLERLGVWIDAALGAGATSVSDPRFAAADADALRHLALTRAVQNARGDAETMASAAGGSLGALLQVNQGQTIGEPMPMMRMVSSAAVAAAPPTNIVPGDIHVTATVTGEWRYIAGPGTPAR